MPELKLWCWKFCPYAQRAWVAFLHTGVDYKYMEINPYENRENKEWRAISEEGKVPVIQVGDETPGLNESLVAMETINELSNNKLTSHDAIENAKTRLDTLKYDKLVTNAWYGFMLGKHGKELLTSGWKSFLSHFDESKGPFFGGSTSLGYVDIAILPWMYRMDTVYFHKGYDLKDELTKEEYAKYTRWCESIKAHPSCKPTAPEPAAEMINFYGPYADKEYKPKPLQDILEKIKNFKH